MDGVFFTCWKAKINVSWFKELFFILCIYVWVSSPVYDPPLSFTKSSTIRGRLAKSGFRTSSNTDGFWGTVTVNTYSEIRPAAWIKNLRRIHWPQLSCNRWKSTSAHLWHSTELTRPDPRHTPPLQNKTRETNYIYVVPKDVTDLKCVLNSLCWEMNCVRMRCREPLLARSCRAPGQSGMSSAWYLAP